MRRQIPWFLLALAAMLCGGAFAAFPASGAAASTSLPPARRVLSLTEARLELMDEVMASKWLSRAPIQDPAQETAVKEAAVAQAEAEGVAAAGTRRLFTAEIAAAKEVQLGWGSHWLFYGAPPDLVAPDLNELRSQLSGISAQIVAALPGLTSIGEAPKARPRIEAAAARILTVRYLGPAGREAIVDALLGLKAS